jgi:hydrogenase maturation protease
LRSDDGIGCRIAQELRSRPGLSQIKIIECRELAPELAESIRGVPLVIFIDATIEGQPGEIRHQLLEGGIPKDFSAAFSHGLTPSGILALAADLYASSPEAHLFTTSGANFHYGESFSPEVTRAFPLTVAEIENLLRAMVQPTVADCRVT